MTRWGSAQLRCAILAVLLAAAVARAQVRVSVPDPTETTGGLPQTPWTWRVPAPNSDSVLSIAFAPDKPSVYLHEHAESLDLWSAATYWWPEILGAAAALATLICGLLFYRVRRRVQTVGAPCCRRCSYDLSAHVTSAPHPRKPRGTVFTAPVGAKCPECGADITRHRPVRGRRRWPRLVPIIALWALIAGTYSTMLALGLPRTGYASQWRDWSSLGAAKWARRHDNAWLIKRIKTGDHVAEIDLTSGLPARTAATRRSRSYTSIRLTPDGTGLFLQGDANRALVCLSTRTGRPVAAALLPGDPSVGASKSSAIFGFSPDGKTAYAQWLDRASATSGVSAWQLADGSVTDLVATPAFVDQRARGSVWGRTFFQASSHEPLRFVSCPDFMEAFAAGKTFLRVHEIGGRNYQEIEPTPKPASHGWGAASPDGRRLFLPVEYGRGVIGIDLETGKMIGTLPTGMLDPAMGQLAAGTARRGGPSGADATLLIVPVGRSVLVRDVDNKAWLARLQLPPDLYGPQPCLSPDGRWVGAICQGNVDGSLPGPNTKPTGFIHHAVLWNIGPILDALPSPSPPSPSPP